MKLEMLLSLILILTTSLFFTGIIVRTKSLFSGRKGPGIFQPVKDVIRLLKKGTVYSETTSYIFRISPAIYFASVFIALLIVPFGNQPGLISFKGDFILFAYMLALGRFFMIISALDTGSSFEGMGASREALFSLLAEPAFFILMGSYAILSGETSFSGIFSSIHFGSYFSYTIGILSTFVLIIIVLIENSRMPVDDPKTHLELTMIHEVIVLDYSGFDLALILFSSQIKFAIFGALIANLFLPPEIELFYSIPVFLAIQFLCAVIIGIVESFTARFRMNHNSQFIFTLTPVSLLIFLCVLLLLGKFF